MKTIDVTPTWTQWLGMAAMAIEHGEDPVSQWKLLKPEFEKMAKLATSVVAEQEAKPLPLTDEQINNVFITAIEGGSNYWYTMPDKTVECLKTYLTKEKTALSEVVIDAVNDGCVLAINDAEEPDEYLGSIETRRMKFGLLDAAERYPERIAQVVDETYDAETADVLFQLMVLGEVTYG